jgi:hypothetical protein
MLIAKSPDPMKAREWLEIMRAEEIEPDASTYRSLIDKGK